MDIVKARLDTLVLDPRNARAHSARNIKEIQRSLEAFGQHAPLVVQKSTSKVLIGNGRLTAMRKLKWKEADVYFVEDDDTTALRRALADNRTGDLSEFADEMLRELLGEIPNVDAVGWTPEEVDEILGVDPEVVDDEFDVFEALPDIPNTKEGEIYELGDHRLVCGDSTDPSVLDALMDGNRAHLLFTDPPYNVDYVGKTADALKIRNDKQSDTVFLEFLKAAWKSADTVMQKGAPFYIFHADSEGYIFRRSCEETGLKVRQCLIWVKNSMVMGRQDYQWQHEPILYGWKSGAGHFFVNDRTYTTLIDDDAPADFKKLKKPELVELVRQLYAERDALPTSVIREGRPSRSTEHPTMKPPRLCGRLIANSTEPEKNVLDLFAGSGSTLIAAEQLKRRAFLVEIDPRYCDVIIARYEAFTGRKAVRVR